MSTTLPQRLKKAGYGEYIDRFEELILAGELEQVHEMLIPLIGDAPFRGVEIPPSAWQNREYIGLDLRGLIVEGHSGRVGSLRDVAFSSCDLSGASFQGHYDKGDERYWPMKVIAQLDSCDLTGFEFEGVRVRAIHLHNCYVRDARKPVELVSCLFKSTGRDTLKITGKALPLKFTEARSVRGHPAILISDGLHEKQLKLLRSDRELRIYLVNT